MTACDNIKFGHRDIDEWKKQHYLEMMGNAFYLLKAVIGPQCKNLLKPDNSADIVICYLLYPFKQHTRYENDTLFIFLYFIFFVAFFIGTVIWNIATLEMK